MTIKCRFEPAPLSEALLPRVHRDIRIVSLQNSAHRSWPRGLTVDGSMIIDMSADGGVEAVEIIWPAAVQLPDLKPMSGHRTSYHKMYIDTDDTVAGADGLRFAYQPSDRYLQVCFGEDATGVSPLLGPGV